MLGLRSTSQTSLKRSLGRYAREQKDDARGRRKRRDAEKGPQGKEDEDEGEREKEL